MSAPSEILCRSMPHWYMRRNVTASVSGIDSATINPVRNPSGAFEKGPCGTRVQMARPIERQKMSVLNASDMQKLTRQINTGTGADKIRAVEVMAIWIVNIQKDPNMPQQAKDLVDQLITTMGNARSDSDPAVSAWASFLMTNQGTDQMTGAPVTVDAEQLAAVHLRLLSEPVTGPSKDDQGY